MTTQVKAPTTATGMETRETRKFTVAEYYRMAEAGILHHTERVELIEGEVLVIAPLGHRHAGVMRRVARLFHHAARDAVTVSVQNPIHLGERSEPQPDIAILRFREDDYLDAHPGPDDILLVIEVSDTTLAYDVAVKVKLYADANIPETWVMNLPGDCLEGFSEPGPQGYARHTTYRRGERISPASRPDLEFAVDDLLPPPVPATGQQPPENAA